MSPTMHKVLIHGAEVITHAILPIGQLSEEAAETRNKHFRQYRQNFSRKFSSIDCNIDVLNRLLLSSDPYISSSRSKRHKKTLPFSKEAVNMMISAWSFDKRICLFINNKLLFKKFYFFNQIFNFNKILCFKLIKWKKSVKYFWAVLSYKYSTVVSGKSRAENNVLTLCRFVVAFKFSGIFKFNFWITLWTAFQPDVCPSEFLVHANKNLFYSGIFTSLLISLLAIIFNAGRVSGGIRTGNRWLFPFPDIKVIFKVSNNFWSISSRSSRRCWSIHIFSIACWYLSRWSLAGSPPYL